MVPLLERALHVNCSSAGRLIGSNESHVGAPFPSVSVF